MAENSQDNSLQLKNTAGSRPSSASRDVTLHWFAYLGPEHVDTQEERETRIKSFKERQNEERQKKLDEMKSQAMAAQRFKEQKESERRLRLDELRSKEDERRQQVEERKKAINEAERDRLESILKRNQEREARIESKRKNERSSLVFAFGSSTPRILGPTENSSSFWGHRRATSTQNITYSAVPLTRRQSERELDGGSKKRATSAGGLERSGEATPQHPAGCTSGYVGRRRTDLMPTIPTKETNTPRKSFIRSPGRAYSMSRLDQLSKPRKRPELPTLTETSLNSLRPLSSPKHSSVSRSMSHLAVSKLGGLMQPPKVLRKADSRSMHQLSTTAPLPPPRTTRATELRQKKLASANNSNNIEAPSRPSSSLSQQSTSSVTSSVILRSRPTAAPRRQRPASIAITGISSGDIKVGSDLKRQENKPPLPKSRKSSFAKSQEKITKKKSLISPTEGSPRAIVSPTSSTASIELYNNNLPRPEESEDKKLKNINASLINQSFNVNEKENIDTNGQKSKGVEIQENNAQVTQLLDSNQLLVLEKPEEVNPSKPSDSISLQLEQLNIEETNSKNNSKIIVELEEAAENQSLNIFETTGEVDMTASINSKPRINTEEEAKAALAERRRIAREEAERQAEEERLRQEEEVRLEFERQQREEEQQRQLIELQRSIEEERLKEAIKEAQKREEELKQKQEEEQKMKLLKEEADKKAREEAERQKAELQERLKNEEKEREARRKRVEAIMLRTRGKNNSGSASQTDEKNAENNKLDSNKVNGSKTDMAENGHKNGKDIETVDNIIPVNTIKNANTVNTTTLHTEDTLNSNDAWQRNSQTDLLM